MLLCTKCQELKGEQEFYRDRSRVRGYDSWCKACGDARDRAYVKAIQEWKETQPCTDCGNFYPHYILQFDHTSGEPRSYSGMLARACTIPGLLKVMQEEQIEIVCANCHCARTWARKQETVAV